MKLITDVIMSCLFYFNEVSSDTMAIHDKAVIMLFVSCSTNRKAVKPSS